MVQISFFISVETPLSTSGSLLKIYVYVDWVSKNEKQLVLVAEKYFLHAIRIARNSE